MSDQHPWEGREEYDPEKLAIDPKRKWLLMGIPICVVLGIFQLTRALGGNTRSWAYVIEWPFFGLFIWYMYWKISHPEKFLSNDDDDDSEGEE